MRVSYIKKSLGLILKAISVCMIVPVFIAVYFKEYSMILPFVLSSILSLLLGFAAESNNKETDNLNDLKKSEALFITVLTWVLFGLFATIPYVFHNISVVDSLFEAFSGITTTGATILEDFSICSKTLLFWRSFTQWLGGMGIIVLFIAVLPQFAIAGRQMFFAEAPGPTEQKITPRIRNTADALWKIYVSLTVIEIIVLKFLGMPLFTAVCDSFSTLAAGGFSPEQTSFLGHSPAILWVVILFMFLAGVNFSLIYNAITKRDLSLLFKDEEFKTYLFIIGSITLAVTGILLWQSNIQIVTAFKDTLFHTISLLTTTGFAGADYWNWSLDAKMFLFLVYFFGGCAGSAAGGLKVIRVLFMFKFIKRELAKILHPSAVYNIKINKTIFPEEVNKQILAFIIFYFAIFALSAFVIVLIERNVTVGVTSAISSLGNVGPGFGLIAANNSFSSLHTSTKLIFIFNMIVGRLELIPFLAMLHPDFWNWKK